MTTSFYATTVDGKVKIPDKKVCGYTMRNNYNRRGASSGLKAGRNNGVVNQRLSRFATKHDAEEKHPCDGNTNWLNHKNNIQPDFMKTRGGEAFKLIRPAFYAGVNTVEQNNIPSLPPQIRAGMGNNYITRNNFKSPPIRPRDAIDFDKLQAIDIETQGAKIQLSDKTIAEIFQTKIGDPQDLKWIEEKARLIARYQALGMNPQQIENELNVNKPLGREQRKIIGKVNIGQSTITMADKLNTLETEVKEGRAESRVQQAQLIGQFALVLADTNAISALSQLQLTNLGEALARVGVPTNHKALGLIPRFVDNDYYLANAGLINLLLFSKVREIPNTIQYNYDRMVKNFAANAGGLPAIKLSSMTASIRQANLVNRRYIDLLAGGVITNRQLRGAAGADPGGFDGENFSVAMAFR
jgi:hypothetical protein